MLPSLISAHLPSEINLIFLEDTPSTNAVAKRLAAEGAAEGTVVLASSQSAGRGRLGRSFSSPAGGIYLSMITRPDVSAEGAAPLTMAACVGVKRALASIGVEAGIKWVNDLIYMGRKIAGILAEGAVGADGRMLYAVTGVGLNYQTPGFQGELSDIAASLYPEAAPPIPIEEMAARLMKELYKALRDPLDIAVYEEYRSSSIALGRRVRLLREGGGEALCTGLSRTGALLLRFDDGEEEELSFGEVSIRMM